MGLSLVWASSRSISFVCPCCLCPQRSFDILYSRVSRQSVIISVLLLSHPSSSSSSSSSSCQVSLATLVVSAIPSCHFFLFSAALRSESRSAPVRIWWAEVTQGGRVHSCGESPRGSHERRGGRDVGAALLKVEQRSTSSCARSCLHVLGMCGDG